MYKKVFLTGGTGFLGSEILRELVKNNFKVKVLVHFRKPAVSSKLVEISDGDMFDLNSLTKSMKGCDAVVHVAGLVNENPSRGLTFEKVHVDASNNLIIAAKKNGIERFIHTSTIVAKQKGKRYQTTKYKGEQLVRNSDLTYTIFRPTIIFGKGDKFTNGLIKMMRFRIVPYFGDGNHRFQPVSVKTVAKAFAKAINSKKTFNKTYQLGGPKVYTYKELLDAIANRCRVKITKIPMPIWFTRMLIGLFGWLPNFPITNEEVNRLLEDNVCDSNKIFKDLELENFGLESL